MGRPGAAAADAPPPPPLTPRRTGPGSALPDEGRDGPLSAAAAAAFAGSLDGGGGIGGGWGATKGLVSPRLMRLSTP